MVKAKKSQVEMLQQKLEEAKDRILELEENVEDNIAEHPVQSVAIAFGAGMITGVVLAALIRKR